MNAIFVNKLKACICAVSLIGVLTCGAWSQLSTIVGAQPPNANSGRPAAYQERGGGLQTKDGPAPPTIQPADKIIDVTQEQVLSAALAADGKFVVAVTAPPFDLQGVKETRIKAWDSKTGELRRTIRDSQFDYCHLAISPSGKQLLVGHGSNMKDTELYDIEDLTNEPRLVQTLANSAKAWSVAFSHDGKSLLIGATDGLLQVYDAKSGEQRWNTGAHDGHVTAVAFSGDGKLVVSAGTDKTVQIRNAQSGGLTSTLQGHTKQVTSAAFSPDGKLVASGGYDGTVRVWDAETGKEVHKISIADASVRSVAFSPDGKTLAIGGLKDVGQTVLGLWNVKTGKQVRELSGHRGGALSLAFSADGMIVMVAGGDGGVGLWRLNRTPERK